MTEFCYLISPRYRQTTNVLREQASWVTQCSELGSIPLGLDILSILHISATTTMVYYFHRRTTSSSPEITITPLLHHQQPRGEDNNKDKKKH